MVCFLAATTKTAGRAAESAAVRKEAEYIELLHPNHFFSIAMESHILLSNKATAFLTDFSRRIIVTTSGTRVTSFFLQHISMTLQRLNAECVIVDNSM